MSDDGTRRLSLKRALGLSTGLHLLLAPFFAVALTVYLGSGQSAESVSFLSARTSVSRIAFERRVTRTAQAVERAARSLSHLLRPPERDLFRPAPAEAATTLRRRHTVSPPRQTSGARMSVLATRDEPVAARPAAASKASAPQPVVAPAPAKVVAVAPAAVAPVAAPVAATGAPSAAPAPSPAAAAEPAAAHGADVPIGGWGQSFEKPLLNDDAAVDALRAKYHAQVTVDVDEAGHAVRVSLPNSLPSDARAEIERTLLGLHYVPAECNGLRCSGTMSIAL